MTEFNYTEIKEAANMLINRFGKNVILRKIPTNTYDPDTDSTTYDANQDTTIKAVFEDFNSLEVDGTNIRSGDVKINCLSDNEITSEDFIIDGADRYSIINVNRVQPGPELIMYILQVRR